MSSIIKSIDRSLSYRKRLFPSSVLVYKVEKSGKPFVLKVAETGGDWEINHLEAEREILEIVKDVPGITHLVQRYEDVRTYRNPILKSYFEGTPLRYHVISQQIRKKLRETVDALHSLGIARLDLDRPSNIVVSSNGEEVCIIDLGHGILSSNVEPSVFDKFKTLDYNELDSYISR